MYWCKNREKYNFSVCIKCRVNTKRALDSFEILCSFRFIGSVPPRYIKKFIDMSEKNSNSYTIYPFIHTCTRATADTSPQQYLVRLREALLSHYIGLQHNHDLSLLMAGL